MIRIASIAKPKADDEAMWRVYAFFASCVFHGLVFGLLLGLTLLYETPLPPPPASREGPPTLTLLPMVIAAPPQPLPPPSAPPARPAPPQPPPPEPPVKPQPTETGVPVVAAQPVKPMQPQPIKPSPPPAPPSHPVETEVENKPATATTGINVMPNPPYPPEAWNLQQTGTVYLIVQFDEHGNVGRVKVEKSSGKPLLDNATLTFVRSHWHSTTYAGQSVNLPIKYELEN